MQTKLKRLGILTVGWFFIALGIVGLFLPILQGILFLLIGLLILSSEYVWAHHLLSKLRERFPKINQQLEKASARAQRWLDGTRKSSDGPKPSEESDDRRRTP